MLLLSVSVRKWVGHGLWLELLLKCPGARLTARSEETQCKQEVGLPAENHGNHQLQLKPKSTADSNMAHMALCQTATLF